MDQVTVNVDSASTAILLLDNVVVEDLVIQSSGAFYNARHFDDVCPVLCRLASFEVFVGLSGHSIGLIKKVVYQCELKR